VTLQIASDYLERHEEASAEPPTPAMDGIGGDELRVWSQSREDQLTRLVQTTYTIEAAYEPPRGLIDTRGPYTDFRDNEKFIDEERDDRITTGTGGGLMRIWSLPRQTQLSKLIQGAYSVAGGQTLPHGIIDSRGPYTDFRDNEVMAEKPDEPTLDGVGGDDMRIWMLPIQEQLHKLVQTTYDNESSYTLGRGLFQTRGPYTDFRDNIADLSEPGNTTLDGTGGGDMRIWSLTRETQLAKLIHAEYSVESRYPIPKGIVNASAYADFRENERMMGISITGTARDQNNNPLSGRVIMMANGEVVTAQSVTGTFSVASPPPLGVWRGGNEETRTQYDFQFAPDGAGYAETETDVQTGQTFEYSYEALVGEILDVNGDPAANETVVIGSEQTTTGADGRYQFIAPAGTRVEMLALERSIYKEAVVGRDELVEWRYGGIRIRVRDPDTGEPIEGAPVRVGDNSYVTAKQGEVLIERAPIGQQPVSVMGHFDFVADVNSEGHLYTRELGGESSPGEDEFEVRGASVQLFDAETGRPISDLAAEIPAIGTRSESGRSGRVSMLHDTMTDEPVTLIVGREDPRYKAETFTLDPDAETYNFEAYLEPRTPTVNN
jgi:hypothetical protein